MQHQIRRIRRVLDLSLTNQRLIIAADEFPNHSRSALQQAREDVRALEPATVVGQAERLVGIRDGINGRIGREGAVEERLIEKN